MHIHAIVEECEIVELIEEIDTKKKKDTDPKKRKPKRKPLFVKNGAVTNITMNTDIDRDLNYREKTNKTRFGLIFYHERSVR